MIDQTAMGRRARRVALAGLVSLALGLVVTGCSETLPEPKPKAPSMAEAIAAFDNPRGELTSETLPGVVESALGGLGFSEDLNNLGFVTDFLGGLDSAEEAESEQGLTVRRQGLDIGGTSFAGDGFLEVKRVCRGWNGGTTPNPSEDGILGMVLGFSDKGIDEVIFGGFKGCREDLSGSKVLLDPVLSIYVGDAFNLGEPGAGTLLFSLDGQVDIDGEISSADLDFRVGPDDLFEIRVPTDDGDIIFSPTTTTFRTGAGTWQCNFEEATCARDGQQLSF